MIHDLLDAACYFFGLAFFVALPLYVLWEASS